MGSKQDTDQVHDDIHTLGKYPIRVRVKDVVRVQLLMEQPNELKIFIN